jgi:chromosome segregation ATPase
MANTKVFKKEELINWMTEIKKSFTFTQKVKFLREFWENKDIIAQLKKERDDWKDAWKDVQQQAKVDIANLNKKNSEKDDKIAGLYKLFQGTADIFNKQHNYVDQLKKQLEQESQATGTSQEQVQHLQKDIQRLDQEKVELETVIQELQDAETKIKGERDQELAKERGINAILTNQLDNSQKENSEIKKVDNQVDALLAKYSNKTGLLAKVQRVIKILSNLKNLMLNFNNSSEEALRDKNVTEEKWDPSIANEDMVIKNLTKKLLREYTNYKFNRPNITIAEWNNDWSKRPTQAQYQGIITQLTTANSNLSSWTTTFPKENASQVQIRINTLQTNNNSLNSQITQKNNQISSLTSQVSSWQINYNTAQTNYNNVNNQLSALKPLQTQLNTANAELSNWKNKKQSWVLTEVSFSSSFLQETVQRNKIQASHFSFHTDRRTSNGPLDLVSLNTVNSYIRPADNNLYNFLYFVLQKAILIEDIIKENKEIKTPFER